MHATVYLWKKEDNLQKLADSFHHVGPVDQTQATRAAPLPIEPPCQHTVIFLFVISVCRDAVFGTEEPEVAQPFRR